MQHRYLVIITKWHWHKNRQIAQCNQTEEQDMNLHFCGYQIRDKEVRNTHTGNKVVFSIYGYAHNGHFPINECKYFHIFQSAHNIALNGRETLKHEIIHTEAHKWGMKSGIVLTLLAQ